MSKNFKDCSEFRVTSFELVYISSQLNVDITGFEPVPYAPPHILALKLRVAGCGLRVIYSMPLALCPLLLQ